VTWKAVENPAVRSSGVLAGNLHEKVTIKLIDYLPSLLEEGVGDQRNGKPG